MNILEMLLFLIGLSAGLIISALLSNNPLIGLRLTIGGLLVSLIVSICMFIFPVSDQKEKIIPAMVISGIIILFGVAVLIANRRVKGPE